MTRIDLIETALIDRGWMLVLAFTVSVILVGVTRKACRRAWGAEYAMQLWVLPPLAMLATQLPHFSGLSASFPWIWAT